MGKININLMRALIERKGKEALTSELFDQIFQFNNRKKDNSRLSLQLRNDKTLLHEPAHNQAKRGTVRIWTDYPDRQGEVAQLAVIGSELYERLETDPQMQHIFVTETIGRGHTKVETKVTQQKGIVPSSPLFVNEPRVATILWFAADHNAGEASALLDTFLTAYFQLVKSWL